VTSGLVESNGSLLLGDDLKVTCGLTACTLGSALVPTLDNECGKTSTFRCVVMVPSYLSVYPVSLMNVAAGPHTKPSD